MVNVTRIRPRVRSGLPVRSDVYPPGEQAQGDLWFSLQQKNVLDRRRWIWIERRYQR
jgi:hypothetical protein